MKVLTAAQMREVDKRTIERGIPGLILMENAGCRAVEFLEETLAPLAEQRVAVICGKGNNAGDGFVIARQLFTRKLCRSLTVLELFDRAELAGDAAANRQMLEVCGCPVVRELPDEARFATVVIDAILGTGLTGPVKEGPALHGIRLVNSQFPLAKKVSIDIASGQPSDDAKPAAECVRADYTVTFVAPKLGNTGRFVVGSIGTPQDLYQDDASLRLNLTTAEDIRFLFKKRPADSNKGLYGKSGAPAMAGLGAYRSGAGLVTVAVPEDVVSSVAAVRPELMMEPLHSAEKLLDLAKKMTVLAIGPGMGTRAETAQIVKQLYEQAEIPIVADADALNVLAGSLPRTDKIRILTPHPGEMSRLIQKPVKEVQADRIGNAQKLAHDSGATVVLKGDWTVIAFPDGETWINPTGSPAMSTGGTGDILTGITAGLVAQHTRDWRRAVIAAVWLHGRCGELEANRLGEEAVLATDLLHALPEAMNEVRPAV
jgi:ADP-dependent NAD(P)H-hydrate dehydratase / NAD(P)H-hydrate epimerase